MQNQQSNDITKKAMMESLKKILKKKPLHKISIREITEDIGVNRQTFYYHFEDIYALVKWTFQEEAVVLLAEHKDDLIWQDGLLKLFNYILDNKEVCLNTVNSVGYNDLKHLLHDDIYNILYKVIENLSKDIDEIDEKYTEFLTDFYTLTFASYILSWLAGDIDYTPEEIITMVDMTLQDQLLGLRTRMKKDKT